MIKIGSIVHFVGRPDLRGEVVDYGCQSPWRAWKVSWLGKTLDGLPFRTQDHQWEKNLVEINPLEAIAESFDED